MKLFAVVDYPPATRQLAFYGQSASLVRYLADRSEPTEFLAFIDRAEGEGHQSALQTVYGIDGVAALEAAWLRSVHDAELAAD